MRTLGDTRAFLSILLAEKVLGVTIAYFMSVILRFAPVCMPFLSSTIRFGYSLSDFYETEYFVKLPGKSVEPTRFIWAGLMISYFF